MDAETSATEEVVLMSIEPPVIVSEEKTLQVAQRKNHILYIKGSG